nr:hypothetical protein GZ17A3_2 [uncultured archaeon GZfos17A3]
MKLSKAQKIVISVVVVGLIVVGAWASYAHKKEGGEVLLPELPEEQPKKGMLISVGCGWSDNNDEVKAVEEAVSSVRTQLGGKSPEFAILYLILYRWLRLE